MGSVLSLVAAAIFPVGAPPADPPKKDEPRGAVYDKTGPPENNKSFKLVYVIYLEGEKEPVRRESSGNWCRFCIPSDTLNWKLQGYEAREVGKTTIEVVGKKMPDGTLKRVTRIEFESPDLTPDQLPKPVVQKG